MRVNDKPSLWRGTYVAVWFDSTGKRYRTSLRTTDRAAAERALTDFRKELAAPVDTATVGAIVDAYLADKAGRVRDHLRLVNGWRPAKPTFGHLRPDQITRDLCRQYTAMRAALGRKPATIIKELAVVKQALRWRGITGAVFELPSAPPPRDRHLTRAEYQALLDACQQPHVRLFCVLALSTAARKTAILELTWTRVDFDRRQIRLAAPGEGRRKGRALVPMTDRLHTELKTAAEAAQTPYVIEYQGARILDIKTGFNAAVARAGLSDVTPHVLRHTAAVWMAEAGTSMDEIAQFLGHTDPKITYRVYARFSPAFLKRAASALEF